MVEWMLNVYLQVILCFLFMFFRLFWSEQDTPWTSPRARENMEVLHLRMCLKEHNQGSELRYTGCLSLGLAKKCWFWLWSYLTIENFVMNVLICKYLNFSLLHQVFVGKIPRDLYEDELVPLFESAGAIWDLRLMMDPLSGQNRGYAFITYCNKDDAQKAVKLVSRTFGFTKCSLF